MRFSWGLAMAGVVMLGAVSAPANAHPQVAIRTGDVTLFYRMYEAAHGAPDAKMIQRDYLDIGSDGVRQFIPDRIVSASALASTIQTHKAVYERARTCMHALPAVKARLQAAFQTLSALDPQATFPPVTVLIGRNNSGGTTGKSGVLIGLEVVCGASWLQPDPASRMVHMIAHEYGHVEQAPDLDDETVPTTVLRQSLIEGVAELVADLISGQVSNVHLQAWTKGHVREIDEKFVAEADRKDLSNWLYNGPGTPEKPGDLGYWVGYRIARSYYDRAPDKPAALRVLLDIRDPKAILADSGWRPGQAD